MKIFNRKISWTTILTFIATGIILGMLYAFGQDLYIFLKNYNYHELGIYVQGIIKFFSRTVEIPIITIFLSGIFFSE